MKSPERSAAEKLELMIQDSPEEALKHHARELSPEQLDHCVEKAPLIAIQRAFHLLTPQQRTRAVTLDPWGALTHDADQLTDEDIQICLEKRPWGAVFLATHRLTPEQLIPAANKSTAPMLRLLKQKQILGRHRFAKAMFPYIDRLEPRAAKAILKTIAEDI